MKITILSLCVTTLLFGGCGTSKKATKTDDNKPATAQVAADPVAAESTDAQLVEKYWKLIELYGAPLTAATGKEAHIIFHTDGSRFSGNAGCNNFSGSYATCGNYRISLTQTVSTEMFCLNMETENKFKEVLGTVDSYYINGDTLILNRARMAPLARFVAEELR